MGKSTKKVAKEKKVKAVKEAGTAAPKGMESRKAEPRKKEAQAELEPLKAKVQEAKEGLEGAVTEAGKLEQQGKALVDAAKGVYLEALEPYREACKQAGIPCEFEGGRSQNKTAMVHFLVEKAEKGIKVTVKGKPDTAEVIPLAKLKESVSAAAYSYVDKWIGPRETVGNKGGGLGNRIRALLNA